MGPKAHSIGVKQWVCFRLRFYLCMKWSLWMLVSFKKTIGRNEEYSGKATYDFLTCFGNQLHCSIVLI